MNAASSQAAVLYRIAVSVPVDGEYLLVFRDRGGHPFAVKSK
jgi:hypothetical protein